MTGGDLEWLDSIAIVNESKTENLAGDVMIFRSVGEACRSLEAWWIENKEGFAFSAGGARLVLGVDASGRVVVERCETCAEGEDIVRRWLTHAAEHVRVARSLQAKKAKVILGSRQDQFQIARLDRTKSELPHAAAQNKGFPSLIGLKASGFMGSVRQE